jgi:hypothetical protein
MLMPTMAIPVMEFLSKGCKIRKFFWLKINCNQMKSLNFANWCDGEVSKVPKSDFQSQFPKSKIIRIFLILFFIEEYELKSTFFVIDIF